MKRMISFILAFSIIMGSIIIMPIKSIAESSMDYTELIKQLKETNGPFETPTAVFDVYVNGSYKDTADPGSGSVTPSETIDALTNNLTCKVGDTIKVVDKSQVGSGTIQHLK